MDLSVSDTLVGRMLDGRYRVEAAIAHGGMATVYRALDTRLDRVVALKLMHPALAQDGDFVGRFIDEARSAARLSHPNVVGVFDQGEDRGVVFLTMEYVEGRTLRHILRERGRLTTGQSLELIEPVLAALAAAHEEGIIHRDVKPENILVGENGRVKVADFGLARALADPRTAAGGTVLGTVSYVSPEQALGKAATPRSDVYSAGIVLYELLTGHAPHTGGSDVEVVRNHVDRDVPPPSASDPLVPREIDELVGRATHRDPQHRLADAGVFLESVQETRAAVTGDVPGLEPREAAGVAFTEAVPALVDPAASSAQTSVLPKATAAAPAQPAARASSRRRQTPPRRSRQRPRWLGPVLFALVMLVSLATVAGAWWLGAGRYTSVPPLLGLTAEAAQQRAEDDGLSVEVSPNERYSEVVESGLVVASDPGPGRRVLDGGTVTLVISAGPERYEVPEVVGMTLNQARDSLSEVNLTVDGPDQAYNDEVDEGRVISQGIEPGNQVRPDTPVPLTVSLGPEPIEIENFVGRPASEATAALTEAGFKVKTEEQPAPGMAAGTVIGQSPSSGTGHTGDTVTLTVAEAQPAVVPDVVGRQLARAEKMLEDAGYTNITVNDLGLGGPKKVFAQTPLGDSSVPHDTQIVLWVN